MKKDWKRKLTSRNFWIAITSFVSCLLLAFHKNAATIQTITSCIMSAASVLAYILGEGLTDSTHNNDKDGKDSVP